MVPKQNLVTAFVFKHLALDFYICEKSNKKLLNFDKEEFQKKLRSLEQPHPKTDKQKR